METQCAQVTKINNLGDSFLGEIVQNNGVIRGNYSLNYKDLSSVILTHSTLGTGILDVLKIIVDQWSLINSQRSKMYIVDVFKSGLTLKKFKGKNNVSFHCDESPRPSSEVFREYLKEICGVLFARKALFNAVNARNIEEFESFSSVSINRILLVTMEAHGLHNELSKEEKSLLIDLLINGGKYGITTFFSYTGCETLDKELLNAFEKSFVFKTNKVTTEFLLKNDEKIISHNKFLSLVGGNRGCFTADDVHIVVPALFYDGV